MKNMCVSAGISMLFNQIRYEHSHHVGASSISLAPTFFKSQSVLMPLLLLSKSNPLRWASIWFLREDGIKSATNNRTKKCTAA